MRYLLLLFTAALAQAALLMPDTAGPVVLPPENPLPRPFAYFGGAVAIDGTNVVIGAPGDAGDANGPGKAVVVNAATGAVLRRLKAPGPIAGGGFGSCVAISGNRVAVSMGTGVAVYDLTSAAPETAVLSLNEVSWVKGVALSGSLLAVSYDGVSGGSDGVHVYDVTSAAPATVLHEIVPYVSTTAGFRVSLSGNRLVVGDDQITVNSQTDAGTVWVYNLAGAAPLVPQFTLVHPAPAADDSFGRAVSVSGNRLLVGSPGRDTGAADAGEAYLYDLSGATPTVAVMTYASPAPLAGAGFGTAVALTSQRALVAAPDDDTGADSAGRAWVFNFTSATPQVTLSPPVPGVRDYYGSAVAMFAARVVVGATGIDTVTRDAGAVFSYNLGGTTPTQPVATITDPSAGANQVFGEALAASGTLLAVAQPTDYRGGLGAGGFLPFTGMIAGVGSVSVFNTAAANPGVPLVTVTNPVLDSVDQFGRVMALSGGLLAVGLPYDSAAGNAAGRVFVYQTAGANPGGPVATLVSPNPYAGERFGASVAVSGSRVAVGVYPYNTGQAVPIDADAVYVYDIATGAAPLKIGRPGGFLLTPTSSGSTVIPSGFGGRVLMDGNYLVVTEVGTSTEPRRLHVFDMTSPTPAVPVKTLTLSLPQPFYYEWEFALSFSYPLLAVCDDSAGNDAGECRVYDMSSATPDTPRFVISNDVPAARGKLGYAVALSGGRLALSRGIDAGGVISAYSAGTEVLLYDLTRPNATTAAAVITQPSAGYMEFGGALALLNSTLAVGSPWDSTRRAAEGSVRLYRPDEQVPELSVQIAGRTMLPGDLFAPGSFAVLQPVTLPLDLINTGNTTLSITGLNYTGTNAGDFSISPATSVNLAPGARRSHTLTIRPLAPGTRVANLSIPNNDPARSSFLIPTTLQAVSVTIDTDGDGMSDGAEVALRGLGFDPLVSQPALVAALNGGANAAGLYSQSQMQALQVNSPLLVKDPVTGNFQMTLDIRRSANLSTFSDFPLTSGQTSVTNGDIRLTFPLSGNANFLRVQAGP